MDNLFEQASRKQLRYNFGKGNLNTEDLWELKLEDLDKLAKALNKELKEAEEGSFIKKRTVTNKTLELKFEIVKHVIVVKMEEDEAKELAAEKRAKKAQLLELIGRKELTALESKSVEELKAELETM